MTASNFNLILASQSPRRIELLKAAGFDFEVAPANIEETVAPAWSPEECVCELARNKAACVMQRVLATAGSVSRQEPATTVILAADTVVALEREIFGKPRDRQDAYRILYALSHHPHRVITGVCLWPTTRSEPLIAFDVTRIRMRAMTDAEIWAYIDTGEGMDKAGAYALQETGERYVAQIEGAFDNVVGLPIALVRQLLAQWQQERR